MASSPPVREAARAILLDGDERVMLLRYEEGGAGSFWATPGGCLEQGESHLQTLRRELCEELGLREAMLGPLLATRTQDHCVGGRPVRQVERYYLVQAHADDVQPGSATNPDDIEAWRWWILPELRATGQNVYPAGLGSLIADLLTSAPPASPRILS